MNQALLAKLQTVEDYDRAGLIHGLRCRIRNRIFDPLSLMPYVPDEGRILDWGCGDGFFTNCIGRLRPHVTVAGVDISAGKLAVAQSANTAPNVQFFSSPPPGSFDAILCVDILHHIHPYHQEAFLRQACERLLPGGVLLIKDIDAAFRFHSLFNQIHDLLAAREWVRPKPIAVWRKLLNNVGFKVTKEIHCFSLGYPHFVLVAHSSE